ncbi:sigma-54-dependent transcriptional regulator [Brucella gallinifaecis]|uniref:DNA-binding transcriptional regulator NtrC n=1 Tax=Brucella gallinifaecis TaxID=215590 RepID=A0A502BRD5_9HYPH|nr:sigma-54 dependent transcriptional regulator [Brucella gallinifaecis]TPF77152.1 sigma-54-dependent Fis family transcriptional regulator [Brucella gallinifaecis]
MSTRILIVDDDPIQRRSLEMAVLRMGYRTILADGGISALGFIANRKDIALILLDLTMPDMDGCAVLLRMREAGINIPVIALVQQDDMNKAMQAIKLGALDFMTKPVAFERMQVSIANVFKLDSLSHELKRLRTSQQSHILLSDLVIKSPEMEKVATLAKRVMHLDTPLLIEGEQGTGKETLARAIIGSGALWQGPFVAVDCRGFVNKNANEILFGQSAGLDDNEGLNFNGPSSHIVGKLAEANGGTLFFDQISALPYQTQIRLFETMQAAQDTAENANGAFVSKTRIIASNTQALVELVHMGRFHPGLYQLISSFHITMPPLRDRIEDIPILAHQFLMQFASEERLGHLVGIAPNAMESLKAHAWPGNVRELKNAIYQAVLLCENHTLSIGDFRGMTIFGNKEPLSDTVMVHKGENSGSGMINGVTPEGEVRTLAAAEEEMIRFAISYYDGQISEVARRLGIGRTTLYRKLKEYGIDVASASSQSESEIVPFKERIRSRILNT